MQAQPSGRPRVSRFITMPLNTPSGRIGILLLIIGAPTLLYNAIDLFSTDWDLGEFECAGAHPPRLCTDPEGVLILTGLGALLALLGAVLVMISFVHHGRKKQR